MYTHAPSFGRAQRFGLRPGSGAFLHLVPFAAGLRAVFWVHGRRVGAVSVWLYTCSPARCTSGVKALRVGLGVKGSRE